MEPLQGYRGMHGDIQYDLTTSSFRSQAKPAPGSERETWIGIPGNEIEATLSGK
jgi:hypothetical protein